MRLRRTTWLGLLTVSLLACFDYEDLEGQPCERSVDCNERQICVNSVCWSIDGDPSYQPCAADGTCEGDGEFCWMESETDEFSFCGASCARDSECPPALPDGTAVPRCASSGQGRFCRLECDAHLRCPDDMTCRSGVCYWP
ncbi:MAG: hypothetical protein AAF799_44460 [Myxococcota bacterium]